MDKHSHADHEADENHSHDHRSAGERKLWIATAILGTFTVVEAVGGYFAHSIALLAESAHMLADCASLILAIIAIRISTRPPDARRTFGHRRYQPLAAFVNGLFLLLLTVWVVYEAVERLLQRPAVEGQLMLVVAIVGGIANFAALLTLSGAQSLNERGARAHVLSDLLGSAAATAAAIVILIWGFTIADPLLSLLVSVLIFRSAWRLTKDSAHVLLEGTPTGVEPEHVISDLLGHVPGLLAVHHVHCWSMTGERPMITLHAVIEEGVSGAGVIQAITARLSETVKAEHTTIQIESGDACVTPAKAAYEKG